MHGVDVDDDDDDNKDEFGDDLTVGDNHDDHENNDAGTGTVICQDKHQECTNWSNVGECDTNPLFMLSTCCRSCHHRPAAGQAGTEEEVVETSTSTSSESGTPLQTPSITEIYTDILHTMPTMNNNNNVVDENGDDYGDDYDYGDGDDSFSPGTPSTTDTTTTTTVDDSGGSDEL